MVKVLHAADFHLDSAFGALTERQAMECREQSRKTLERLVDYANDHGAELMLLAGDLFDSDNLYGQTVMELVDALSAFRGQVVIAPGNHDYFSVSSPWAKKLWPDNVHIFTDPTIGYFDFPQYGVRVFGAAFTAPEQAQSGVLTGLELDKSLLNIGVLHGDVGVRDSRYRPISPGEIKDSGLDYLALGHVHTASGLQTAGDTVWAYPGCLEGRGFDETGEKGFLFGTVDKGGVKMQFVPFSQRRYCMLQVDVTEKTPMEAIEESLATHAENDIYRIILTGETAQGVDVQELCRQLEERFFALEIRDKTTIRQDIWARQEEDSLRGLFLREMRRRYESAQDEQSRQKVVLAVRFGLNAMDNREV